MRRLSDLSQDELIKGYLVALDKLKELDPIEDDGEFTRVSDEADHIWRRLDDKSLLIVDPLTQVTRAVREGLVAAVCHMSDLGEHVQFDVKVTFLKGHHAPFKLSTSYPWETLDVLRPDIYESIGQIFGFATRPQKVEVFEAHIRRWAL